MNQEQVTSRRALLSRAAIGTAATTLAFAASTKSAFAQTATPDVAPKAVPTPQAPQVSASDLEIANFALGLERLEAAFYAQIQGAQQARAYLNPRLLQTTQEIGANEIAHIEALQNAIIAAGGTPVGAVNYKFPANVFISPVAFTWFGYTLEEIGIGAYLGAIGQIKNAGLRRAAASIYGSETRHAGLLRSLGGWNFAPRYFESPLSVAQVRELIAPYIA
ncbi:MAG TPA: ferritin-like domain-containing protein [Abditibacterium sp.]|jgi:hypothetical protein